MFTPSTVTNLMSVLPDGFESIITGAAMTTFVDLDAPCEVAVIVAVPAVMPAVRVVVAVPVASVVVFCRERLPSVVVKLTGSFGMGFPIMS